MPAGHDLPIVHQADTRASLLERMGRLRADSQAVWGEFGPAEMLFHVNAGMEIALGELKAEPVGDPAFWHSRGKAIALESSPWPPGAPTSPEALPHDAPELAHEQDRFRRLLGAVAARNLEIDWPAHPRLGPMSGHEWSRLTHNHIDHHLRQFGL